jgi:hypothetical protein
VGPQGTTNSRKQEDLTGRGRNRLHGEAHGLVTPAVVLARVAVRVLRNGRRDGMTRAWLVAEDGKEHLLEARSCCNCCGGLLSSAPDWTSG